MVEDKTKASQTRDLTNVEKLPDFIKGSGAPVSGKNVIYFLKDVDDAIGTGAIKPLHQLDGSYEIGGDVNEENTKDGKIVSPGTVEETLSFSQYFATDDEANKAVINAKKKGKDLRLWRVITDASGKKVITFSDNTKGGLYPSQFAYVVVDTVSIADGVDGFVQVDYSLKVQGSMQDGEMPISDADMEKLTKMYDYENPGEKTGSFVNGTISDK